MKTETHQSILVLSNEGYPTWEIGKKLEISYNTVYYSLQRAAQTTSNQNRKMSGGQEDKYNTVSTSRNRRLTGPQQAASLNSTNKRPVVASTVKRWLWDAGHLGRIAT